MAEQPPNLRTLAFFRWQEWVAFRRHVVPTSEETCGDLLLAEARLLAAMGELEAAAGAAARALSYYEAHDKAGKRADVSDKIGEARGVAGAQRVAQQATSSADQETPDLAALERDLDELSATIKARIDALSVRSAQDAVRTLNAFRSTSFGVDPLAVRVVSIPVAKEASSLRPFVLDLAQLERRDPEAFRALVRWLGQKAATSRAGAAGGLELPDVPETGESS